VTVDYLTCERPPIEETLERRNLFGNELCSLTKTLLERKLLVRLTNWPRYFDANIGEDVAFLRRVISRESIAYERDQRPYDDPITNRNVTQVLRAEYRLTFFCHGKNKNFNYAITNHMLRGISRGRTVEDTFQVSTTVIRSGGRLCLSILYHQVSRECNERHQNRVAGLSRYEGLG